MKKLTKEEEAVIKHKGTEYPFTGKYYQHKETGTYTCKQCGQKLFSSDAKFDSGTGWPSFDDAIKGAIKKVKEKNEDWYEIQCTKCGGHLGHVFDGEGFTKKNKRYCVNSICLDFKKQ